MKKSKSRALASILLALSMMFAACADSSDTLSNDDVSIDNISASDVSVYDTTASNNLNDDISEKYEAEDDILETIVSDMENDSQDLNSGTESPFSKHGRLSVDGTDLVDKNGEKYQLYGMSTHGLAWYPQYVNQDAFDTLLNQWNTNCIRLAMYTYESGGYCSDGDKEALKSLIKSGVEYADNLGMYVIIDWHVLNDQNPNVYKDEAIKFFDEMTDLYKDHDNIIYEICNEPNTSVDWSDIKSYAEEVIPVIRENDSDAVIIVGTPTWSQDIDQALADPLDFDNVMYALHFYADTHKDWLRERVENCINMGLPVFISEFNICDASGRGNVNVDEGNKWYNLIDKYNLSYMCWSLANNPDSCCVFSVDNPKLSGWTEDDLSLTGKWLIEKFKSEGAN